MNFIRSLRSRYKDLSDKEFERFLRLAYANESHRIPAPYRQGFQTAGQILRKNQRWEQFAPPSFAPTTQIVAPPSQGAATVWALQEQRRQREQTIAEMERLREEAYANRFAHLGFFASAVRFADDVWNRFFRPAFSFTGTLGGALAKTVVLGAGSPIFNQLFDWENEVIGAWRGVGMMLDDIGYNISGMLMGQADRRYILDPEDYLTLGAAVQSQPNIFERIRQGQANRFFDVLQVDIQYTDGRTERKWVAPFEIDRLRSDPSVLSVQEDESTRIDNLDRVGLFGLNFNRHYLQNFGFSLVGDLLNWVGGLGAKAGVEFAKAPLRGLRLLAKGFQQASPVGKLLIGADLINFGLSAGFTAPIALLGKATGIATRRLPSVAEIAKSSPILNNAITRAAERLSDQISSTILPYFYNLETQGMRPSSILRYVRPLFNMTREQGREFLQTAAQRAEKALEEWGTEGQDFSDDSWNFIKTTLNIRDDVATGQRKQYLIDRGLVPELSETLTMWRTPPPVASAVVEFGHRYKPAFQVWKGTLYLKDAFDRWGATKYSNLKRVAYPVVRLFNGSLRHMEEIGREIRQAQQAVISEQRDAALAMAKAMAGNPEYRNTALGQAIAEHEEAYAKLTSAIGGRGNTLLQRFTQLLDAAGVGIADDASAVSLLNLYHSILKQEEAVVNEISNLSRRNTDAAAQAADEFLRRHGILTSSPEHSLEAVRTLNSRSFRSYMGAVLSQADPNTVDDAIRRLIRSTVELRRYGLTPEMALGIENIYYGMKNVYDTLRPDQRQVFQEQLNKHITALMTGQAFDPREIRSFYQWMDEMQLPPAVKEAAKQALEAAANRSVLERFTAANADAMKGGIRRAMQETDRLRKRIQSINRVVQQVREQGIDPCL